MHNQYGEPNDHISLTPFEQNPPRALNNLNPDDHSFTRLHSYLEQTNVMVDISSISVTRNVPGFVDFLATNHEFIWATNQDKLQKFSSDVFTPVAEIDVPQAAGIPVCGFGAVWVASLKDQSIYKIDQESNQVLAVIKTGLADLTGEFSLCHSPEAIWLAHQQGYVCRIHPTLHNIEAIIEVLPHSYNLSYSAGSIWITNTQNASVQKIDTASNKVVSRVHVDEKPWFLSASNNFIWTLNQRHGTVSKIDPINNCVIQTIQLPVEASGDGGDIYASNERVWVRTTHILLIEIDAASGSIIRYFNHPIAAGSGAVMQSKNQIWVTAHDIDLMWTFEI